MRNLILLIIAPLIVSVLSTIFEWWLNNRGND